MSAICFAKFPSTDVFFVAPSPIPSKSPRTLSLDASFPRKFCGFTRKFRTLSYSKSSEVEELSSPDDEWLKKLPEKKKPLYSHSLPCIEAWLRSLGFYQSKDDRAVWFIEKPDWHAQLSLDVTDLYIRFDFSMNMDFSVALRSAKKSFSLQVSLQ